MTERHPVYVRISKLCDPDSGRPLSHRPFYAYGHTLAVDSANAGFLAVSGGYADAIVLDERQQKIVKKYLQDSTPCASSFKKLAEWAGDPNWDNDCPRCEKSGLVQCVVCEGRGKGTAKCGECGHEHDCVCEECEGKKTQDCSACEGSGHASPPQTGFVVVDGKKLLVDRVRLARLLDALPEPMRNRDDVEVGVNGECLRVRGEDWSCFLMGMRAEEGEQAPKLELP